MPSLADIPDELLDQNRRQDFVSWLVKLPLGLSPRRELAAIWRRFTKSSLTPEQWQTIIDTVPKSSNG